MKLSVSVPDDLWQQVHDPALSGPSETVQAGLAVLAAQRAKAQRPLAHAPDQNNLDQYRDPFEAAVTKVATTIKLVRNRGYQLGLLLAPNLSLTDFDVLETPAIRSEIRAGFKQWGDLAFQDDDLVLSNEFWMGVEHWFEQSAEESDLLGAPGEMVDGVTWIPSGSDDLLVPDVHDDLVTGVVDAFKDVRNESIRRMNAAESGEHK